MTKRYVVVARYTEMGTDTYAGEIVLGRHWDKATAESHADALGRHGSARASAVFRAMGNSGTMEFLVREEDI